ncbi:GNAT family N-acetyltransferase [Nonomuraea sp. NPDC000554]|uniref:GNAT family N-acetyltransferase n=1 Tax=Nonomuraea sp. NPDC000554 TaxID=3154259 RepID=UPI0033167E61
MDTHAISRPTVEDAPDIHELVAVCDTAAIGVPDATLDDIADSLVDPGVDLGKDGWLARDAAGVLDGWAWAHRVGDSDLVEVDVIVRPGADGLAVGLWHLVLQRARELAAESGHDGVTVDIGVYQADEAKQALAKEHGFQPSTSFQRMRIDHDGPVEPPAVPEGVTLVTGEPEDVRREAHQIHQAGFADHYGFVKVDFDHWHARRQSQRATDWGQLVVARHEGRPAALLIGSNQFLADLDCGYVATLAVMPEFRGRGLGRFLLRHAFAADAARGRGGTVLHVDSNNTTPALGLYLSVGMRSVLAVDVWRCRIDG